MFLFFLKLVLLGYMWQTKLASFLVNFLMHAEQFSLTDHHNRHHLSPHKTSIALKINGYNKQSTQDCKAVTAAHKNRARKYTTYNKRKETKWKYFKI